MHSKGVVEEMVKSSSTKENVFISLLKTFKTFLRPGLIIIALGLIPIYIITRSFGSFIFPLYSQSMGYLLLYISSIIVIAKATANLLDGVIMTISNKLGTRKMALILYGLFAFFLIVFYVNNSYIWSILIILMLELGRHVVNPFTTSELIEQGKKYGANSSDVMRAMESMRSVFFIIRPILLGVLIGNGYSFACLLIGIITLIVVFLYLLTVTWGKIKLSIRQKNDA